MDAKNSSKNHTKPSSSKKRRRSGAETLQSYTDRLLYQCRKDLRKNAKISKNFECQKIIRKIKQQKNTKNDDKLKNWRELPLEPVIDECFRRLGVSDLLAMETRKEKSVRKENTVTREEPDKQAIERILQHKRMREALESWSLKVTEYRRWCSRNNSHNSDGDSDDDDVKEKRKRKPNSKKEKQPVADPIDSSHSLFMTLNTNDEDEEDGTRPKKNRAGQKARRAKAQALEARREGRSVDKSSNWREALEKNHYPPEDAERQPTEEEKQLHPSWEASKTKQSSIVEFQGKKITFD